MAESEPAARLRRARGLLVGCCVLAGAALAVAGCGSDEPAETATAPAETDATVTVEAPDATTTGQNADDGAGRDGEPADAPGDGAARFEVTVADGVVQGGPGDWQATVGDSVELVVRSDSADHVHVHGYDVLADVAADTPATVAVEADIPGVFEVELENAGLHLGDLTVNPA